MKIIKYLKQNLILAVLVVILLLVVSFAMSAAPAGVATHPTLYTDNIRRASSGNPVIGIDSLYFTMPTTQASLNWLTQDTDGDGTFGGAGTNKGWHLVGRRHDYVTAAEQNDLKLYKFNSAGSPQYSSIITIDYDTEEVCIKGTCFGESACPTGWADMGTYCIQRERASSGGTPLTRTYQQALQMCYDFVDQALLCRREQWALACLKGQLTDIAANAEEHITYSGGNYRGINRGSGNKMCTNDPDFSIDKQKNFRCCKSK